MSHLSWLGSTRVHCSLFVHWLYWYYVIQQQFAFFFFNHLFFISGTMMTMVFLNSNNSSFFRTQYPQLFLSGFFFFSKVVGKPSIGQIPTSKIVWSQYYLRNVTSYIQPYLSYFLVVFLTVVFILLWIVLFATVYWPALILFTCIFFFFLCYLLSSLSTLCPPVDGYRPYIWLSPCSC